MAIFAERRKTFPRTLICAALILIIIMLTNSFGKKKKNCLLLSSTEKCSPLVRNKRVMSSLSLCFTKVYIFHAQPGYII